MLDEHPMFINIEEAFTVLTGYPEAELDRKVFTCIASCANSQGVAWPTQQWVATTVNELKMSVCRSTKRLKDKNLFAIGKEKKGNDRNPRNVYTFNPGLLRKNPDTRSSHFDAGKWGRVAAQLKKFVSDAVDDMKQVVTGFAQTMSANAKTSAKKRKTRAHRAWNQRDYRQNSWKQSYEEPALSPEERQRQDWINRLIQQGKDVLEKAHMTSDGEWEARRYIRKCLTKTPEKYDSILQDAIEKFKDFQNLNCFETRVQLGLDPLGVYKQSHPGSVSDVRCVSPGDEPMSLKGAFGAAFA